MRKIQVADSADFDAGAVILVEGNSDRIAVETLAARVGRDLASEGIAVVTMGGAHAIGRSLARYGPLGANLRIAGLYDAGEEFVIRRALQRAGPSDGSLLTRDDLEKLGFYVCVADLEDELIRALGADAIVTLIDAEGELDSFHTLQKEPAWRVRRVEDQLRRFLGNGGRKIRYARLIVNALDLDQVPRPLRLVLAHL